MRRGRIITMLLIRHILLWPSPYWTNNSVRYLLIYDFRDTQSLILTGAWPLAVTLAVFSSNIFRLGKVKRTLATSLTEVVAAPYFALGWTWKNCLELTWLTLLKHYLIDACFFFRILRKFTFCTQHSDTPGLPCLLPLQLPWSLSKAKNILWEHLDYILN